MISFKDLCVDVSDLPAAAAFLGPLLGLEADRRDPDVWSLVGQRPEQTVWLNQVLEPRQVKNRVHLDVDVAAVADVIGRGAEVVDASQPWTVLTHAQTGELCAFVRPPERLHPYRLYEVVVDAADPGGIAGWWARQYGVQAQTEDGYWFVEGAPGMPWATVFVPVPEPKTVKNRVHWDVRGATAELLADGARLLRGRDDEIDWDVLADPEGNEFCVFAPEG